MTDSIRPGVIAKFFHAEKVREILKEIPRAGIRERDLPAHVVVCYVIALAMYMRSSYREVLRCLLEGAQWLPDLSTTVRVAGKSCISQARRRLGVDARGAAWRTAIRSSNWTLDTADTVDNERAFGSPGAGRGSRAFPPIRFLALSENGTHVLWAARMERYATGGITLAHDVVPALHPGMLCRADRFFPSYGRWQKAAQTGADLLWRTRRNARLDPDRRLSDGSYLIRICASTSDRRNQRKGIVVRVIDYRLNNVEGAEPVYRLITTILDPTQAPAKELAALYHERRETETAPDQPDSGWRSKAEDELPSNAAAEAPENAPAQFR